MATIKIGALLVKTLAKPMANAIKAQTQQHPKFKAVCVGIAQSYHQVEMQLKQRFLNYNVKNIKPLSEAQAVNLGSNFIGESFIFAVAGGLIFWERSRASDRKEQVDENISFLLREHGAAQAAQAGHLARLEELEARLDERVSALEALLARCAAPHGSAGNVAPLGTTT